MKCKNCGLPRSAHIESVGFQGQKVWQCPDGSGDTYPAVSDVKVEFTIEPPSSPRGSRDGFIPRPALARWFPNTL
jgi:hypothetical protein